MNPFPLMDPFRFDIHLGAFLRFVEEQDGQRLTSFRESRYLQHEEGYKIALWAHAQDLLRVEAWQPGDIGRGTILASVQQALHLANNNLVDWRNKDLLKSPPGSDAGDPADRLTATETALFHLFRDANEPRTFQELVDLVGRRYDLIACLFFLKDCRRFLPIRPSRFDQAFEMLGIPLTTSGLCSFENYTRFLAAMQLLQNTLQRDLPSAPVQLLDAHSFAWILANQMQEAGTTPDMKPFLSLSETEQEQTRMARRGQGRFRQQLLEAWNHRGAVTGCAEIGILIASHIKPWAHSAARERLDPDNGLPLIPNLDACFDSGWISFDERGQILLSPALDAADRQALGLHADLSLRRTSPSLQRYLAYHRDHLFQPER